MAAVSSVTYAKMGVHYPVEGARTFGNALMLRITPTEVDSTLNQLNYLCSCTFFATLTSKVHNASMPLDPKMREVIVKSEGIPLELIESHFVTLAERFKQDVGNPPAAPTTAAATFGYGGDSALPAFPTDVAPATKLTTAAASNLGYAVDDEVVEAVNDEKSALPPFPTAAASNLGYAVDDVVAEAPNEQRSGSQESDLPLSVTEPKYVAPVTDQLAIGGDFPDTSKNYYFEGHQLVVTFTKFDLDTKTVKYTAKLKGAHSIELPFEFQVDSSLAAMIAKLNGIPKWEFTEHLDKIELGLRGKIPTRSADSKSAESALPAFVQPSASTSTASALPAFVQPSDATDSALPAFVQPAPTIPFNTAYPVNGREVVFKGHRCLLKFVPLRVDPTQYKIYFRIELTSQTAKNNISPGALPLEPKAALFYHTNNSVVQGVGDEILDFFIKKVNGTAGPTPPTISTGAVALKDDAKTKGVSTTATAAPKDDHKGKKVFGVAVNTFYPDMQREVKIGKASYLFRIKPVKIDIQQNKLFYSCELTDKTSGAITIKSFDFPVAKKMSMTWKKDTIPIDTISAHLAAIEKKLKKPKKK